MVAAACAARTARFLLALPCRAPASPRELPARSVSEIPARHGPAPRPRPRRGERSAPILLLARRVVLEVDQIFFEILPQPGNQTGFELADALARHVELVAELLERLGLLRQNALLDDLTIPRVGQRFGEGVDFVQEDAPQFGVGYLTLRVLAARGEKVAERSTSLFAADRRVDREIGLRETLLHVADLRLRNLEPLRDQPRFDVEALPLELALLARRAKPYQTDIVEQVLQDVRANPVRGVRGKFHALVGVVALHGLKQSNVPLLDEIENVRPGAAVVHGDLHHQAEVREYQFSRGVQIPLFDQADGKPVFLVAIERRVAPKLRKISRERVCPLDPHGRILERREGVPTRCLGALGRLDRVFLGIALAHSDCVTSLPSVASETGRRRLGVLLPASQSAPWGAAFYLWKVRMYAITFWISASERVPPQGAMSGEPPYTPAPFLITLVSAASLPGLPSFAASNLNLASVKSRGCGFKAAPTGPSP